MEMLILFPARKTTVRSSIIPNKLPLKVPERPAGAEVVTGAIALGVVATVVTGAMVVVGLCRLETPPRAGRVGTAGAEVVDSASVVASAVDGT